MTHISFAHRKPKKINQVLVVFQICTFTGQYAMVIPPFRGDAHGTRARDLPLVEAIRSSKGQTETGKQRYRCQRTNCPHRSFVLEPVYNGRLPQVKEQIIDMALNGSGIRDTARVLKISPTTVLNELKKKRRR